MRIPVGGVQLEGELRLCGAGRLVVFAHGSGSSRHSPRNKYVADVLNQVDIDTLLFDMLTLAEDRDYANRFDIDRLAERLLAVTAWLGQQTETAHAAIGYFGASTGAAAALRAAAELGGAVSAVVSRGGRPDLAGAAALSRVTTPTLLIVGGLDVQVLELNRQALAHLAGKKKLDIIPGATHLFEESGTLESAAAAACRWFDTYLPRHAE
ncbi:dienelactone hydrolase family protein [Crenobacter sp. SG2303]|uniref:Dienelactone hydrolase family protein n=1 Tax=Crenobacter oryzisoli TaxID=3056844 RepID=A0ABT7XV14_9NEIS|nr:alpha/beta family hydrolase [Crenobacter sp. SG2303]MDN0077617.1 dienelactone hydrolase family protein [Crenobacter sp. SG2303]